MINKIKIIDKLVIANRGEIALRILRCCKELGIKTVALHSNVDSNLIHVKLADESVCIGPGPSSLSYLNIPAIISACEITDAVAVHPGYGFLSENPDFAEKVEHCGFIFVGPKAETIRLMGDKISAINAMKHTGIPCIPGSYAPLGNDNEQNLRLAKEIGYPIIIKAAGGGGGRGMKVVHSEAALLNAIALTKHEAKAAFDNDNVYMEKFLTNPRHIEIQVVADGQGNAIYLGDRDCSIQRRHQKVIEEAPAPGISTELRKKIGELCVNASLEINYRGVGTFEFLYENEEFYFIEMNTRIQVEHPITELITGIDIVKLQLEIAAGNPLKLKQQDVNFKGHAIECRINAEDPNTFMPCPGKINFYHAPGGPGIRIDSHIYTSYVVPPNYDSLLGKLISFGNTREQAIHRMQTALEETIIDGIKTNIPLHQNMMKDANYKQGQLSIHYLEKNYSTKPG